VYEADRWTDKATGETRIAAYWDVRIKSL